MIWLQSSKCTLHQRKEGHFKSCTNQVELLKKIISVKGKKVEAIRNEITNLQDPHSFLQPGVSSVNPEKKNEKKQVKNTEPISTSNQSWL